jgi:hypothetical protein
MSENLKINGATYDLSTESGLAGLAAAVEATPADAPIMIEDTVVFRPGWNRNGFQPHPRQLARYAKSAKGTPILYCHDDQQVLGASRSMRLDPERGLLQTMELEATRDGVPGGPPSLIRRMLALRIAPRFSISWLPGETTQLECSECKRDMRAWDAPESERCPHYPGQRLEGRTVMALVTDCTHAETSLTFSPAVPGTGLESKESELAELALSIRLHKYGESNHMDPETEVEVAPVLTAQIQPEVDALQAMDRDKLLAALRAATDELAEMGRLRLELQARRHAEVLAAVRGFRSQKGIALSVSDEALAAQYTADPTTFRALMAALPDSPLTQRVTGIPPLQADPDLDDSMAVRDAALAMERETKQPYAACLLAVRAGRK